MARPKMIIHGSGKRIEALRVAVETLEDVCENAPDPYAFRAHKALETIEQILPLAKDGSAHAGHSGLRPSP